MARRFLRPSTIGVSWYTNNVMLYLAVTLIFLVSNTVSHSLLSASSASGGSTIRFLPGFNGPLPFHLETGYVGVGEEDNVQLFYYFVKSERSPEKDPLLLWLTGGPGCSAWSGLAYEIGPVNFKRERYNGSLPTLVLNQYSWTKVSNIIFVDSPVGTGFSYAKNTSSVSQLGDFKQVQHLLDFFKNWLLDHLEFISHPIYITGDSYSGIIAPVLLQEILIGIQEGTVPPINLKGYILGNPVTDPSDKNYKIPFAHGMALISDELFKSLEISCGGEYQNVDPNNTKCLKDLQSYEQCISGIYSAHILEDKCPFAWPRETQEERSERRWLEQNSKLLDRINYSDSPLPSFGSKCYDYLLSRYLVNDPQVQKALHIKQGSIGEWQRCNDDIRTFKSYQSDVLSTFKYHVNLSAKGLFRSLIYSGDHDLEVPFLATQGWIRSLNYSIVEEWRPWVVQDQVAGYTRIFSNRMTFATIKGGGHTAPEYRPKQCLAMFQRWIDYEPLTCNKNYEGPALVRAELFSKDL